MPDTILNPDDQSQSAQLVRHVSLTQLGALHAVPPADLNGGQAGEERSTTLGNGDISLDDSTKEAPAADG